DGFRWVGSYGCAQFFDVVVDDEVAPFDQAVGVQTYQCAGRQGHLRCVSGTSTPNGGSVVIFTVVVVPSGWARMGGGCPAEDWAAPHFSDSYYSCCQAAC